MYTSILAIGDGSFCWELCNRLLNSKVPPFTYLVQVTIYPHSVASSFGWCVGGIGLFFVSLNGSNRDGGNCGSLFVVFVWGINESINLVTSAGNKTSVGFICVVTF
jgi:hypothetical protein